MNIKIKFCISKIIEFFRNFLVKLIANINERKMVKNHKDWKNLSIEEKRILITINIFLKL